MPDSVDQAVADNPDLVDFGRYGHQIRPYVERFGIERIHLVLFEDFRVRPQEVLDDLGRFLGASSPLVHRELEAANVGSQRLRVSPWRDRLLDNPVAAAARRRLVPKRVRSRLASRWQLQERPELSAALHDELVGRFDEDLEAFDELFGPSAQLCGVRRGGALREHGPVTLTTAVVRLTVEPGSSLYFAKDARLTVRGTLVAAGSPTQPIRFGTSPSAEFGPDIHPDLPFTRSKWGGIHFVDSASPDNVIAHARIDGAQGSSGSLGVVNSIVHVAGVEFSGSHLHYIFTDRASVVIEDSIFPDMFVGDERPAALGLDGTSEHIKGVGGIPTDGRYVVRGNTFGTNRGHNACIDVDSSSRPAPILEVVGNVFAGVGDKCLALGGDAYVSGNVFQNVAKDPDNTDPGYASAIGTGRGPAGSTVVVARNIFLGVDHAVSLANGDGAVFEGNTVVGINPDFIDAGGNPVAASVINFFVDGLPELPGSGAYAGDNIVANASRLFGNIDLPEGTTSDLVAHRNQLPEELAAANFPGSDNFFSKPRFVDAEGGDYTTIVGSPVAGAMGDGRIQISGEPDAITPSGDATLSIGGPGLVAYRYRVDGGPWSEPVEIPLAEPRRAVLELTDLSSGDHMVEAYGQDFAGNWQPESLATASRVWTVDPTAPAVVLSEIGPGWVELQNRTGAGIDVSGRVITSSLADVTLPEGAVVPANAVATFPLAVELLRGDGVVFDGQEVISFGSVPDGFTLSLGDAGEWAMGAQTPGEPNALVPLGSPLDVRINEWFASPEVVLLDDFAELANPADLPVDLAGFVLSDGDNIFVVPPRTFLPPGGFYLAARGGGFSEVPVPVGRLDFGFDGSFETLTLRDGRGSLVDRDPGYHRRGRFRYGAFTCRGR